MEKSNREKIIAMHLKNPIFNSCIMHHRKVKSVGLGEASKSLNSPFKNRVRKHYGPHGIWVSTVFLNFAAGKEENAFRFETMVFKGENSTECIRSQTHREALKTHAELRRVYNCHAKNESSVK